MADERCDQDVAAILAGRRRGDRPDVLTAQLGRLPAECRPALTRAAEVLLAQADPAEEGALAALLEVLTQARDDDAVGVLLRAIESASTRLKEDYLSMLDDLDEHRAGLGTLVRVLRSGPGARDDLAVSIRALHAARFAEAADAVALHVGDDDRGIRGLAVDFLYDIDDGEVAAPVLLERLFLEPDPEIVEQIVGGLERWHWTAAVPALRRFAEDASKPAEARARAADAADRIGRPS